MAATIEYRNADNLLQVRLSFQAALIRADHPTPSPSYFDQDLPAMETFSRRITTMERTRNNPIIQELFNFGFAINVYQEENRPSEMLT